MMKSAKLEWCLGDLDNALKLLDEGLAKYPRYPKLWMRGQISEQREGDLFNGYFFTRHITITMILVFMYRIAARG